MSYKKKYNLIIAGVSMIIICGLIYGETKRTTNVKAQKEISKLNDSIYKLNIELDILRYKETKDIEKPPVNKETKDIEKPPVNKETKDIEKPLVNKETKDIEKPPVNKETKLEENNSKNRKEFIDELNHKENVIAYNSGERVIIYMIEEDTLFINQPLDLLIKNSNKSKEEARTHFTKNINTYAEAFYRSDEFKDLKKQLKNVGFKYVAIVVDDRFAEYISKPIKL